MDFAHVFNGYRYHTKYDHIDYLPPSVLQRTGDNILALVKIIANSDELSNTKVIFLRKIEDAKYKICIRPYCPFIISGL